MNNYAQLAAVKADLGIQGTSSDDALLRLIGSVSRAVDDLTYRHFYSEIATRYFDGDGRTSVYVDDLISITTLAVDLDGDGTYETSLTAADYWLWPDNKTPKRRIDLNPNSNTLGAFPSSRRSVQIVGTFGYSNDTELVGTTTAEALDASETGVDAGDGTAVSVGETILIESEQMYVSDINANTLTVVRGINGTTATTHLTGLDVYRRRYPEPVERAVAMQAVRFQREGQSGNSGIAGASEMGGFSFSATYPAIRDLLAPYMIPVVV